MDDHPQSKSPARHLIAEIFLFALCSVVCMSFVFGTAMLNRSLLAPLDIPSALYSKYHWLDENQNSVPQNHYIVDIFDHELPRQYSIWRAIQAGEFPWWDPYTEYGRPLVAEAHISGTDAIRLALYRFLPFVPAYNATKLLNSFLLGLGTFLLLRHFGHRVGLSVAGALGVQFCGAETLFQTPLCVSACATWYPWLWLAWSQFTRQRKTQWLIAAGLFCALSIVAGNQQTHAFLALFGACFIVGNWLARRDSAKTAIGAVVVSGILGALLALPILLPQIELYLLCQRTPAFSEFTKTQLLTGPASFAGLFPWALGTFRTIDLSKLFSQGALGFCIFIGCAGLILSLVGAGKVFNRSVRTPENSAALILAVAYLVICSTPLVAIFYTRVAILVSLALVILAVEGAEILLAKAASRGQRRLILFLTGGIVVAFLCCNLFAFLVYPRVQKRIEAEFLQRQQQNHSFDAAPAMRESQIENLPREISLLNPETVFGVLSALALLPAAFAQRARGAWLSFALVFNLLPELSFAERFTVKSPVASWQKLLAGGPEQRKVATALAGGRRLNEQAPGRFEFVFPGALAHLYQLHASRGYSSFPLPDLAGALKEKFPERPAADATYVSAERGQPNGGLTMTSSNEASARFQWQENSGRKIQIVGESLNRISLNVDAGTSNVLWRTDRYYPGWRLVSPKLETRVTDGFLTVNVPAGRQQLTFSYRPRHLTFSIFVSAATALACIILLVVCAANRSRPAKLFE